MANSGAGDWRKTLFVRITEKIKGDMVNRCLPAAWRDRNTLPGLAGNTLLMCAERVLCTLRTGSYYMRFSALCTIEKDGGKGAGRDGKKVDRKGELILVCVEAYSHFVLFYKLCSIQLYIAGPRSSDSLSVVHCRPRWKRIRKPLARQVYNDFCLYNAVDIRQPNRPDNCTTLLRLICTLWNDLLLTCDRLGQVI